MQLTRKEWDKYVAKQRAIRKTAASKIAEYIQKNGVENRRDLINAANVVANTYGEASASVACDMFEEMAMVEGLSVDAIPSEVSTYDEVAKAVNGAMKRYIDETTVASVIERIVKMAGADTMLDNAERFGAEWAWIPSGDTCAFCITLASNGWQKASAKVRKGNHAAHIHSNCDCEFMIRFDENFNVAGYDPDAYLDMYYNADTSSYMERTSAGYQSMSQARINGMRRENYAKNKDAINARRREVYAKKKQNEQG